MNNESPTATPPTKELADFVRSLSAMADNHLHGELAGRRVAVLGHADDTLIRELVRSKVKQLYVIDPLRPPASTGDVIHIGQDPLRGDIPVVDVMLFDARRHPAFDHVTGVTLLVSQMRKALSPDGLLFCILKTGAVNQYSDLYNPIVRTNSGALPSYEFLLAELFTSCAVRPLAWVPESQMFETVRFFRVSLKKPTLMLILGRSQSGKTSLARDLRTLDPHMHVSTDYAYSEIIERTRRSGAQVPEILTRFLGDGSGKACGEFNRELERNNDLLREYIAWIIGLLPRSKQVVSVEFDVINEPSVTIMKEMFAEVGFSVWVVRR